MEVKVLRLLLLANLLLLGVGLISPIVTLEKFLIIENTFSVLSGVFQLLQEGPLFLFVVIVVFSVVLPLVKLGLLLLLTRSGPANDGRSRKLLRMMHDYGRWSMLDVFIVAVLVVAVKLDVIAQVEMRYGLYAFAAAVLMTMILTERVVRLTDRLLEESDPVE